MLYMYLYDFVIWFKIQLLDSYCCESTGLYIPAATVLSVYVDEASVCGFCVYACVCWYSPFRLTGCAAYHSLR